MSKFPLEDFAKLLGYNENLIFSDTTPLVSNKIELFVIHDPQEICGYGLFLSEKSAIALLPSHEYRVIKLAARARDFYEAVEDKSVDAVELELFSKYSPSQDVLKNIYSDASKVENAINFAKEAQEKGAYMPELLAGVDANFIPYKITATNFMLSEIDAFIESNS